MSGSGLESLAATVRRTEVCRRISRVQGLESERIQIEGSTRSLSIGDQIGFLGETEGLRGEVVRVDREMADIVVEGDHASIKLGEAAVHLGPMELYPSDAWIGRVLNSSGQPLDGRPVQQGQIRTPLFQKPPPAAARRGFGARLSTGLNALNTFLPMVQGQRIGLFAGSGVGKSSLLGTLATELDADICVVALVGERGREVSDFVRHVLGAHGLRKSVVIASTSDEPSLSRRRAALSAMCVAEYFRDQGRHVLFLMDSVTRFAEAHREIATLAGELPAMRGYPPSTQSLLASLVERAGSGSGAQGDITAVFSVLVAGSDMDEPIADTLRGLLDGHIVLSREIAERGRFPAIDVMASVSRSFREATAPEEEATIEKATRLLTVFQEAETLIKSGLFQPEHDPELAQSAAIFPPLDAFLGRRAINGIGGSFACLRDILGEATP